MKKISIFSIVGVHFFKFSLVYVLTCTTCWADGHNHINLQMADGQNGQLVDGYDSENTIGLFTVANLNDTDGDGTPDNNDPNVPGEVDLCQMKLNSPGSSAAGGDATLTVPPNAKLYKSSDKTAGEETRRAFPVGELPLTLWVEFQAASASKRAEEFWLRYDGADDKVKATAIWATYQRSYNTGSTPPNNLDNAGLRAFVGQGLGILVTNGVSGGGVSGTILHEFKIMPASMESVTGVRFDIARQKETTKGAFPPLVSESASFPSSILPNDDDPSLADEDVVPKNGRIYSMDTPFVQFLAPAPPPQGKNVIYRGNFFEYVRVAIKPPHEVFRPSAHIDGDGIPQDIDKMGSVCSPKQPWLTRMWIVESGGAYVKRPEMIKMSFQFGISSITDHMFLCPLHETI